MIIMISIATKIIIIIIIINITIITSITIISIIINIISIINIIIILAMIIFIIIIVKIILIIIVISRTSITIILKRPPRGPQEAELHRRPAGRRCSTSFILYYWHYLVLLILSVIIWLFFGDIFV